MKRYSKALAILLVACSAIISVKTPSKFEYSVMGAAQQDDDYPIVAYDTVEPSDPKAKAVREKRGKRYDNRNIIDGASERGGVTIISEVEYPALPVLDSDVVLIGDVTEARAHLSNDKTGVYSEFTTRVCEVKKQDLQAPINPDDFIATERPGGRVRYSSGKIAKVKLQGWGGLRQGRKYLLFLKRNAERENFTILTGYELRAGKVYPIDGAVAAEGNKKWPFDSYQGADQSRLLSDLQKEIANPKQRAVLYG